MKKIILFFIAVTVVLVVIFIFRSAFQSINENRILKQIIERLEADSRIAEVLVTGVRFDENAKKAFTTIKFLEYNTKGEPLEPKYFTFPGNIIQFQSLVIRFEDLYIRNNDALRGKSAYVFWKVFMLDGRDTLEYKISNINEIPHGYKVENLNHPFEGELWQRFWSYALDPGQAKRMGIKNAQIEAPGTMFIPGTLYTIKIEHDAGIRIDVSPLPAILRGERIPN